MNYRHLYHAGGFADVLKHAVMAQIILYLQKKDAAFRILDTHAGIGLYDLSSPEAQKTGEWQGGIGRLLEASLPEPLARFLAPYLEAVRNLNPENRVTLYPGSPKLARMLMRKQDRLSAIELHPADHATLAGHFAGDHQVRVTQLDGWLALGSHLPPKEKRGLIVVDPPFEKDGDYDRLADGLARATRLFPGGTYLLWHPVKASSPLARLEEKLKEIARPRTLVVRLLARGNDHPTGINGSGLVIVNPPFTLEADLRRVLPDLAALLATGPGAGHDIRMLVGEA